MLNPLNFSAAFGLAKIQEEYDAIRPMGVGFDKGSSFGYRRQHNLGQQGRQPFTKPKQNVI